MLKRKQLIIFFIAIWSLLVAEVKIGYVDSNEIMNSVEEVKQVKVDLEKVQRRLENEMNDLMARLDSLNQDYERQRLLMSDIRRQQKEAELKNGLLTIDLERIIPEEKKSFIFYVGFLHLTDKVFLPCQNIRGRYDKHVK